MFKWASYDGKSNLNIKIGKNDHAQYQPIQINFKKKSADILYGTNTVHP